MEVTPQNPFVGPRPIEKGQPIFGRDPEITELYDLLFAERIVLLHSPSGAGKSSLIQAGLIPRLAEQFDVWKPVRVNLPPQSGDAVNRFVRSCNIGFEAGVPKRLQREEDSLSAMSLAEYVAGRPIRPSAPKNIILIFDQFEEILTVDPLGVEAKREFFGELGKLLQDNPRIWALFAIREDYLAPFDPYAEELPTHLKSRFRLDLLGRKAAEEAISRTVEAGGRSFAPQALGRLVADLAMMQVQQPGGEFTTEPGPYIEPLHLQVVCRNLWERMAPDRMVIEDGDIESFGDVTGALAEYYNAEVAKAAGSDERVERAIRAWVGSMLITRGNIRGQVLREAGKSGGLDNSLIQGLIEAHLVRGEQRAGATWYELSHDRLIKPVQESNKGWFALHLSELQKTTSLWEEQGKPEGLLFLGGSLKRARVWANKNRPLTTTEEEFLAASVNKNRSKQLQIAVFCTVIALAIGATVGGIGAWRESIQAHKALAQSSVAIVRDILKEKSGPEMALAYLSTAVSNDPLSHGAHAWISGLLARREWWLPKVAFEPSADLVSANLESADLSQDGRLVATGSKDGTVQIWDAATGARLGPPMQNESPVDIVGFSDDGRRVIVVSKFIAEVWDTETHRPLGAKLKGHTDAIFEVDFSLDGKKVVTASADGTARIWDAGTGLPIGKPLKHDGMVVEARFSKDGKRVVTASMDKTARVWDATTGEQIGPSLKSDDDVDSAAFSPDGAYVLASTYGRALVWNAATGRQVGQPLVEAHDGYVNDAEFSHDGKNIVTASYDRNASIWSWDPLTGATFQRALAHEGALYEASFTQDDKRIITFSYDNRVQVWDVASGQSIGEPLPHPGRLKSVQLSRDGSQILTASENSNAAQVWELEKPASGAGEAMMPDGDLVQLEKTQGGLRVVQELDGEFVEVFGRDGKDLGKLIDMGSPLPGVNYDAYIRLSGDDRRLLTAIPTLDNGRERFTLIQLWDLSTGKPVGKPLPNADSVYFSPDGHYVLLNSGDTIQAFNSETGTPLKSLNRHLLGLTHFSPDRRSAVTAYYGGAQIWDVETGKLGQAFKHSGLVNDAEFSADGSLVVTASSDRFVHVWDAKTGQEVGPPLDHSGKLLRARFSPDGNYVLAGTDNDVAQVWDFKKGQRIGALMHTDGPIKALQFSADGKTVLTSTDRVEQAWDANTGKPIGEPMSRGKDIDFAVFSPDGREVITASRDDGVRTYRVFLGSGSVSDNRLLAKLADVVGGYQINERTGAPEVIEPRKRIATMEELRKEYNVPEKEDFLRYFVNLLSAPLPEKH
jgi:WD40 repeat protein